jgi:hypothetical protein
VESIKKFVKDYEWNHETGTRNEHLATLIDNFKQGYEINVNLMGTLLSKYLFYRFVRKNYTNKGDLLGSDFFLECINHCICQRKCGTLVMSSKLLTKETLALVFTIVSIMKIVHRGKWIEIIIFYFIFL